MRRAVRQRTSTRSPIHLGLVPAFLAVVTVCGWPAEAQNIRDSSGVTIVENEHPQWGSAQRWRIKAEPILQLGVETGDRFYEFAGVRGVVRLSDGRFAVADAGSNEVRVFSPSGDFVAAFGGGGNGPGEFQSIIALWETADREIAVADNIQRRITFFDGRYRVARAVSIEDGGTVLGEVAPGRFVTARGNRRMSEADVGKVILGSVHYTLHDADGRVDRELAVIPDAERLGFRFGGSVTFPYIPFSAHAESAAGAGVVAWGSGGQPEFTAWIDVTATRILVRWEGRRRREATDWVGAYLEGIRANARSANDERYYNRLVRDAPLPRYLPVYQDLLVDGTGRIWVERYRAPGETTPEWDVFDVDGIWLGKVETPHRFRVMEIGDDYLAGVFRDELDVEYVRVYELLKRGGSN